MEIKINKEIKEYTETMFFGLSVRQFIFALLACGAAVGIYFGCRSFLGTETLSWLCMVGEPHPLRLPALSDITVSLYMPSRRIGQKMS